MTARLMGKVMQPGEAMHRLLRLASIMVLLMLTTSLHAAGESKPSGKILKWVDENGVTHYGDTIPPQYAGKSKITISPRGIAHPDATTKPAETAISKETEQSRRDRTLQSVYSSEQEIDLARDRNLQMDEAMLEGLEQRKLGAAARLQSLKQNEGSIKTRNKPIPNELKKDIKDANQEIGKIDEQIVERKQHMDTTRQRFESDKRRFNELRNGTEDNPVKVDPQPNSAKPANTSTFGHVPAKTNLPPPASQPAPAAPNTQPAPASPPANFSAPKR